jgi:hypothetical protein
MRDLVVFALMSMMFQVAATLLFLFDIMAKQSRQKRRLGDLRSLRTVSCRCVQGVDLDARG